MRRLALIAAVLTLGATGLAATATGDDSHTYFIELDNAFGLVSGSEVKVAGVQQGTVKNLFINSSKRAVVEVELSGPLSQLGQDTICSSEPQSLIAEYFIDCEPKGPPMQEGTGSEDDRVENPDIPVAQTRQTVQNDLVQSALREPFKERLTLIINEFGTALAGNPENLNEAIRRGAPALEETRKITRILGQQNTIIRDLNANSDEIIGKLAQRREDVVKFIENAKATAEASADRRDDLSRNFEILDNFLARLQPTMRNLNKLAVTQTPLLHDLRLAAPGLATLSRNLPDFNAAGTDSLVSLGKASKVGKRALRKGKDEIDQLADSGKNAPPVADNLAKFLSDLDDPRRAVEIDTRVKRDTGRSSSTPATKDTMGYTGLEGLLNYVYYQAGAINQYDTISHLLHFSIFEVGAGPCAHYNAGMYDPDGPGPEDPQFGVPNKDGSAATTDFDQINRCVSWIGPNQPGINSGPSLPPYSGEACPDGSSDPELCDPSNTVAAKTSFDTGKSAGADAEAPGTDTPTVPGTDGSTPTVPGTPGLPDTPDLPGTPSLPGSNGGNKGGGKLPGGLDGLLDLPKVGSGAGLPRTNSGGDSGATRDLLGFLFQN